VFRLYLPDFENKFAYPLACHNAITCLDSEVVFPSKEKLRSYQSTYSVLLARSSAKPTLRRFE